MAVFGLGALLAEVAWLYEAVRLSGAAYLLYFGARMLWAARHPYGDINVAPSRHTSRPAFQVGLLVGMTNPKSAAFFGSLFVTVLPAGAPAWTQAATLGIVASVATLWFCALALMFSAGQVRSAYAGIRRPMDALMGAALVVLGLRLAVKR